MKTWEWHCPFCAKTSRPYWLTYPTRVDSAVVDDDMTRHLDAHVAEMLREVERAAS